MLVQQLYQSTSDHSFSSSAFANLSIALTTDSICPHLAGVLGLLSPFFQLSQQDRLQELVLLILQMGWAGWFVTTS
jgi:hypothetical protein